MQKKSFLQKMIRIVKEEKFESLKIQNRFSFFFYAKNFKL